MKIRNDTRAGLMALSLSLLLLPLVSLISEPARADEFMKWERIPLQIPLQVGLERVVFVDKNVRVGFPPALNGKLRVQSTGGAVYLKADSAFPQTRCSCRMWKVARLFFSMSPPVKKALPSPFVWSTAAR